MSRRTEFGEMDPMTNRLQSSVTPPRPQGYTQRSEHTKDEAGVCEAYPGIIESSDIDPLHHERLQERSSSTSAASKATGAAQYVYSAAMGDEAGKKAAKEKVFGGSK